MSMYEQILDDFDERWNAAMTGRGITLSGSITCSSFYRLAEMYQGFDDTGRVRRHVGVP